MEEEKVTTTSIWDEYKRIVQYNKIKDMYTDTEDCNNAYHGNVWEGAETGEVQLVNLNIIKPIVKFKIGIVNSNSYQIVYGPTNYESKEENDLMGLLCKALNKHANKSWELEQIDRKVKRAIKDASILSEGILYKYTEEDKDKNVVYKTERVFKNNIAYGNENDDEIQDQPYIIIAFRRDVASVKEEARKNKVPEEKIKFIMPDNEIEEQEKVKDGPYEISPMCLVLLKLYKKDGVVYAMKSTQLVEIQEETSLGTTLYPVAHFIWEDVEGSARGEGAVKSIIANQREIDKTAMRRIISVKMSAYPRLALNSDQLTNRDALDQIGSPLIFSGQTVDDVNKKIGYLHPESMSGDSKVLQEELIDTTRTLEGASEINTGSVNPEQASGRAILAVQQAAQAPLNEQVFKLKTFLEDLARIDYDMWMANETQGMVVMIDEQQPDGSMVEKPYRINPSIMKKMKANITIDITPKTPFDKFAQESSLENLLVQGKITFEEYVASLDDDAVMPKFKLQKILTKRDEARRQIAEMEKEATASQANAMNQLNQQQDSIDQNAPPEEVQQ